MKYQRIIEALYKTPLLISPAGFEIVHQVMRAHLVNAERPDKDFFGDPMAQMEIEDGVAVIPVIGPLMQHASLLDKQCGITSYDDIAEDVAMAEAREDVDCIVFNFDSPGGQVKGCFELAEQIAACEKDTYAWTDSQCCSAAYALAAGCDKIYASRNSIVGSIGVIMSWVDDSENWKQEGYAPVIITSGKYKATGAPGTKMTADQEKYVQGLVDSSFEQFMEHVLEHRPDIDTDDMQGQIFHGIDAEKKGLVDGVYDELSDMLAELDPSAPPGSFA